MKPQIKDKGGNLFIAFFRYLGGNRTTPPMQNLNFSGNFANKRGQVSVVNVGVFQFSEDDNVIVYSPAFDLSGYGKSEAEAKESFAIAIEEFFTYTIRKKTLLAELKRLGWNVEKKKKLQAPELSGQIVKNDYLAEILNDKQFTKFEQQVSVPC